MSRTAIILVTYNGWNLTAATLSDLKKLPGEQWVIVVADNGSQDGTIQKIRLDFPEVLLLELGRNLGFGAANNAAIRKVQKFCPDVDAVCLLNNDTRLEAKTLKKLRKDLDECESECVFTPWTLNKNGNDQINYFGEISHAQFFLNAFRSCESAAKRLHGIPKDFPGTPFRETFWASAVCWLMKLSTWKSVGGFDENIFMYYEDVDWAYRARALGVKFLIDPGVSLTHLGGGSAKSNLSRSLQHDSSQLYFYRKHFGIRGALLSRSFRATRSLVRVILQIPAMPISKNARASVKLHTKLFLFALGLFRYRR